MTIKHNNERNEGVGLRDALYSNIKPSSCDLPK